MTQTIRASWTSALGTRPFSLLHQFRAPLPVALAGGHRPPLLVLMHGVGSNERSMAAVAAAVDPRFAVVNVRSPLVLGPDRFAFFHVNFTPEGPVIERSEAERGWQLISQFIDEAIAVYDVDPAQVYVAGFSQGGIMSLATLLTAPGKVAAAVCMSGRLLPEVLPHAARGEALQERPVLIVHGTNDKMLDIHYARWAREQLEQFPVALTYQELPIGHAVTMETLSVVTNWLTELLDAWERRSHLAPPTP